MDTILDQFAISIHRAGDDRAASRHRFEQRIGHAFETGGVNVEVKRTQKAQHIAAIAGKVDTPGYTERARLIAQARLHFASPHDEQIDLVVWQPYQRIDQEIQTLLMRQPPDTTDQLSLGRQAQRCP
jgi:hypothetical protein